jgi:hypothetical protein
MSTPTMDEAAKVSADGAATCPRAAPVTAAT